MLLALYFIAQVLSGCNIIFTVSTSIQNPNGIHCRDSKNHEYTLEGYNCQSPEEFVSELTCYYSGEGCDGRHFLTRYPSCDEGDIYRVEIEKSMIPDYCFNKNPYLVITNDVLIDGFDVYLLDSYNNSFIPIPKSSTLVLEHEKSFSVHVYYVSDLCNLNESLDYYVADVKGNFRTIKQSSFLEYCEPLKIRFIYDFPDIINLYYGINSDNNTFDLESNSVYVFGYLFNMSVFVSTKYNNEKLKIDKIYTGNQKVKNYEITDMDIPEQYRIYKVEITNNINKTGFNVFAKFIGDEKYNKIENGQMFNYTDTKKFLIEIYLTSEEYTEYYYCKTVVSSLLINSITLTNNDIPLLTNKNYNITISNNITYDGYKVYAIDSVHKNKIIIPYGETVVIERKEIFNVNVSVVMDACISGKEMYSLNTKYENPSIIINNNAVSDHCYPYIAGFNNSEPNNYQFYYSFDYENDSIIYNVTDDSIESGIDFTLSLFVTSRNGRCIKQKLDKTFSGGRSKKVYDLVDYIPKKCQIIKYKVIIDISELPNECTAEYTTSLNSTKIAITENINFTSEEYFEVNIFLTYKYCKSHYIGTFKANPYSETSHLSKYYIPSVCNNEDQIYQAIFNISDLPSQYSIEYQIFDYNQNQYEPSKKATGLINITKNTIFGIKAVLTSSPGCTNYTLAELTVDRALPMENITINSIPLKCRMKNGNIDNEIRENDILNVRYEIEDSYTSEQIRNNVQDLFNDDLLWENDDAKDKVVEIQLKYPMEYNMNLEDNQYISLKGNTDINYESGNLNLLLDSSSASISSIQEEIKLKVKGGGSLSFTSENNEVNVPSSFIIYKSLKLYLYGGMRKLNIDSMDVYEKVKVNTEMWITNIKNFTVKQGADVSIEGINIIDTLTIQQPSCLTSDGVNENASIVFNLKSNSDISPMLQGSLKYPPKTISIKNDAGEPEENQEITLIAGDGNDFMCGSWLDALDLDGSGYNEKECFYLQENSRYLDSKLALKIKKTKKDDDNKPDKKGGLKPAVIAAIVIAVVVVVAVVIIVVVIVIRKRKNYNNSESENDAKAENI